MLFSALGAVVVLATSTLGSPLEARTSCSLAGFSVPLPSGQTQVVAPAGVPVTGLVLGAGVQNYTCSDSGSYTSAGAVAELFDVSCLAKNPSALANIPEQAFTAWKNAAASVPVKQVKSVLSGIPIGDSFGQHYFFKNDAGGISPKWDHTSTGSTKGNVNAFAVGKKLGGIPSPKGSTHVDWLSLEVISGELADVIIRYETRSGQPPSTCTPGSALISVKYTTLYAYIGGSVKSL